MCSQGWLSVAYYVCTSFVDCADNIIICVDITRIKNYQTVWPWSIAYSFSHHQKPSSVGINVRYLLTPQLEACSACHPVSNIFYYLRSPTVGGRNVQRKMDQSISNQPWPNSPGAANHGQTPPEFLVLIMLTAAMIASVIELLVCVVRLQTSRFVCTKHYQLRCTILILCSNITTRMLIINSSKNMFGLHIF